MRPETPILLGYLQDRPLCHTIESQIHSKRTRSTRFHHPHGLLPACLLKSLNRLSAPCLSYPDQRLSLPDVNMRRPAKPVLSLQALA